MLWNPRTHDPLLHYDSKNLWEVYEMAILKKLILTDIEQLLPLGIVSLFFLWVELLLFKRR